MNEAHMHLEVLYGGAVRPGHRTRAETPDILHELLSAPVNSSEEGQLIGCPHMNTRRL